MLLGATRDPHKRNRAPKAGEIFREECLSRNESIFTFQKYDVANSRDKEMGNWRLREKCLNLKSDLFDTPSRTCLKPMEATYFALRKTLKPLHQVKVFTGCSEML